MPGVDILINSYDLEQAFGVMLEEGGLEVFEMPSDPKTIFFNEWPEFSGKDYDDTSPFVHESRMLDIPFLIVGNDMDDYRKKKKEFLDLVSFHGEFDFQIIDWGETYALRLKGFSNWEFLNMSLHGETSARFIMKCEDNYGIPKYRFKYLTDNLGRYFLVNDKKMLVKSNY